MLVTRSADYAVRVVVHLASFPPGTRLQLYDVAEVTSVPRHYLAKVVRRLIRAGLVESRRGTGGGVSLAVAPERLSMLDVIEIMDGPIQLNLCVTPGMTCDRRGWCSSHLVWIQARDLLVNVLRQASVAEMARHGKLLHANWDALDSIRARGLVS